MSDPILLTEDGARELLSGVDPRKLCPPLKIGRRNYWSREALNLAVRERAGLPEQNGEKTQSAYDAWKDAK